MTAGAPRALLRARGLCKTYPGVVALDHVALEIQPGEVHALVGENGAGKSTLAQTIAGIVRADGGELWLADRRHAPHSRREAEADGVRMVMQGMLSLVTPMAPLYVLFPVEIAVPPAPESVM